MTIGRRTSRPGSLLVAGLLRAGVAPPEADWKPSKEVEHVW